MTTRLLFTLLTVLGLWCSSSVEAQERRNLSFTLGGGVGRGSETAELAAFSVRYGFLLSDSFSLEVEGLFFDLDLSSGGEGNLGAGVRLAYTFDMLSYIPSLFLGLGGGYGVESESPFMHLQYGLSLDYLYSRRWKFGVSVGGISVHYFQEEAGALHGWYGGVRVLYTLGEEW